MFFPKCWNKNIGAFYKLRTLSTNGDLETVDLVSKSNPGPQRLNGMNQNAIKIQFMY
jgi:hypothetical protein